MCGAYDRRELAEGVRELPISPPTVRYMGRDYTVDEGMDELRSGWDVIKPIPSGLCNGSIISLAQVGAALAVIRHDCDTHEIPEQCSALPVYEDLVKSQLKFTDRTCG